MSHVFSSIVAGGLAVDFETPSPLRLAART